MSQLQLAIIADIHANIWALDAVLADIKRRGIKRIINLGDILYGPLAPRETAERIRAENLVGMSIQGNNDRLLYESAVTGAPTVDFVREMLGEEHLSWLRTLPTTMVVDNDIFACHGTPTSDETYLLEEPSVHGVTLKASEQIRELLGGVTQRIVLCGHSHVPRAVWLPGGQMIINPGSVGVPAYEDDEPVLHKMEVGSPHARYAIVAQEEGKYRVEQLAIPYDWSAAVAAARAHGREDWAKWLALGRA